MAFGGDYEDGFAAFENNDYKKAAKHFKLACDGGDTVACSSLGVFYANGWGVKKDHSKALEAYKKACDGGDVISCNELGVMNRIKHRISYL